MTASKLVPQEMARRLLDDHPATAMELALEIVRLIDLERVREARLQRPVTDPMESGDSRQIVEAVCSEYGVEQRWLMSQARYAQLSVPRKVAWKLLRVRLGWSYERIGALFDRDHTTVSQALKRGVVDVSRVCRRLDDGNAEAAE